MTNSKLLLNCVIGGLLTVSAFAKIERSVEKTFPATTPGVVSAKTHGGDIDINVQPGATSVRVVAKQVIDARTDADADELLAKRTLEIVQTGNEVRAQFGLGEKTSRWSFTGRQPVVVHFEITVPPSYSAELSTSGGEIEVGDLEGSVKANTSGGDIELGRIGGTVNASTSGGDIDLDGHVTEAKLTTSGGDIHVQESAAPLSVSTSGGDVTIDAVRDRVRASTSGGNVRANFLGSIKESASLETSGGSISVTVPLAAAFRLDASTSGGSVKGKDLSLTADRGALGKNRVEGDVNGGGTTVKLRTSGGDIRVDSK